MFIDSVERRLGVKPRLITPEQLRLVPDAHSKGGQRLCCVVNSARASASATVTTDAAMGPSSAAAHPPLLISEQGEPVEEIFQVGLELHQRELAALTPEMLRQVSLRCFNDMRTVLLVHDKRMLGVVKQELPRLVARGVLTQAQAGILDRGVVDTLLPGSGELQGLVRRCALSPALKDQYILKPIRGGKGAGIVFGDDLDNAAWLEALNRLAVQQTLSEEGTFVVQRRIRPRLYDVVLKASGEMVRYPLVGTYHVSNGKLLGLGTWRASGGRIVAVSCGGSWVCSVIRRE